MICPRAISVPGLDFKVPCRKCVICKKQRSTEWAFRLMLELESYDCASFVTLTYDNEHLPEDFNLCPKDLELFWKCLRKRLSGKKIKYYACGEYGDKGRPHYHAIIFNLDNHNEYDRQLIKDSWNKCDWSKLEESSIGSVTYDSCNYVAGYIQKKLYGEEAERAYSDAGITPPFARMSKGIGFDWARQNLNYLEQNGFIAYQGRSIAIPRAFTKKFDIDTQAMAERAIDAENIKQKRWFDKIKIKNRDTVKSLTTSSLAVIAGDYGDEIQTVVHDYNVFDEIERISEYRKRAKAQALAEAEAYNRLFSREKI